MKTTQFPQPNPSTSKKDGSRVVQNLPRPDKTHSSESKMNLPTLTTLAFLALSVLAFLAYSLIQLAAPKPILVEQRRIRYRRRP